MSKWRCKQSGVVIDIPDWEDKNMEGHDGYDKVEEVVEESKTTKPKSKKEQTE
jgi:hypothetical protein